MNGIVIKSTGSWYEVLLENNQQIQARLKGVLRLQESIDTNPIAVGDAIFLDKEENDWMITGVAERKNFIVRASPKHKGARQILAANLDQCFLIASLITPKTSAGFIDRFLLTAEAYHIPTHIIFNKQDALDPKTAKKQAMMAALYEKIGYPVHLVSAINNQNVDALRALMMNKTTLFAGHSGVGKSSLLNAIDPSLNLKTKAVSKITGKGMHTTTFAEMYLLEFGAKIIDTPGIRELGIMHFQPEEISHYFTEMRPYIPACKFNNCMHENEPECAVKKAYQEGIVSEERFISYLNIMQDYRANFKHWEN